MRKRFSWPRLRPGLPLAIALACFGACLGTACQTGRPDTVTGDGGSSLVVGQVVKGPVGFATVTAYAVDGQFQMGQQLASTTCDAAGNWSLTLPIYAGHVLFVASNGSYTDEAVGVPVPLGGSQLVAVVHDYLPDQAPIQVTISPISHWAKALAAYWVSSGQEPLPQAVDDAYSHLNHHFGGLDWRVVSPTDFNQLDGGAGADVSDTAGLLLAGLSQQALGMAHRAAVTPGEGVTGLDLVNALADDLSADGYFDGVGTGGPLHLPASQPVLPPTAPASATALDGQTVRGALALALSNYLQNPLDQSGLTFRDIQGLLDELSTDADTRLFRSGGTGFDVTPPFLAFSPVPPLYTPDAGYTLGVLAADPGSGVAAVYAQTGASPQLKGVAIAPGDAGVLPDGGCLFGTTSVLPDAGCIAATLYQFQLSFPSPGHYPYVVWGVDNAGNSTQTTGTSLNFTMTFDSSPPQISTESTTQTYWSEQGMSLVTDGGAPVIPAAYSVATSESSVFATPNHDVYKAGTRLSWGPIDGGPSGAQLANQDPTVLNAPLIPYDIAYNANVDSPITSCTYSVTCSGAACGSFSAPATGPLVLDTGATTSVRYLMPLTADTLPALTQITGPVTLSISITATDGAGNSATKPPDSVTFHVIGPPLVITEDTSYATANDAHSTFPHVISNNTYAVAFDAGSAAFAPDSQVRLVRYVVYNPTPQPVGLYTPVAGTWSASEEWDDDVQAMGQFDYVSSGDGLWCQAYPIAWLLAFDDSGGRCQNGDPNWPCPGQTGVQRLTHANGYNGCVVCDGTAAPVAHTNLAQGEASASVVMSSYSGPQSGGGETTPAPTLQTDARYVIVPAASGGTPGRLALYVNRPVGVNRSFPLIWQNIYPAGGTRTHYQHFVQDFWNMPVATQCTDPQGFQDPETEEFGSRDLQNLDVAKSVVSGSFNASTYAVEQGTGLVGYGESQSFNGPNFSRTISQ